MEHGAAMAFKYRRALEYDFIGKSCARIQTIDYVWNKLPYDVLQLIIINQSYCVCVFLLAINNNQSIILCVCIVIGN